MKYLFICSYAAPYKGNFICSIEKLEKKLLEQGNEIIYAFPEDTKQQEWCDEIIERTKVYFLPKSRFNLKTYLAVKNIYKQENVDVVHSHFELYDIPATIMANKKMKIFWHLHDAIDFDNLDMMHKILNKIQYKFLSKKVTLISVCDFYRKNIVQIGMKEKNTITIPNGIDLDRIQQVPKNRTIKYNFYTFGWDYHRKGIDILLKSCKKIETEGYKFNLLLNGNDIAWKQLEEKYSGNLPNWLIKQEFVSDINCYIKETSCFIQASRRETFSYSIAEMTYAGIDVISSDIEGTKWAKELPTVQFFESENYEKLYLLLRKQLELKGKKNFDEEAYNKSRQIIEKKYSIDNWVNKIIEVYEENKQK